MPAVSIFSIRSPKKKAEPKNSGSAFQAGVLYPAPGRRNHINKPEFYIPLPAGGKDNGQTMAFISCLADFSAPLLYAILAATSTENEKNPKKFTKQTDKTDFKEPYYAKLSPGKFSDPNSEAQIIREAKAGGYDGVVTAYRTTPLKPWGI